MYQQLALDFNEETELAINRYIDMQGFLVAASFNPEVVSAARVWLAKRGGDLSMSDIRKFRDAVRTIPGYDTLEWGLYENFLDMVAEAAVAE